jgi:hypothetical protein
VFDLEGAAMLLLGEGVVTPGLLGIAEQARDVGSAGRALDVGRQCVRERERVMPALDGAFGRAMICCSLARHAPALDRQRHDLGLF